MSTIKLPFGGLVDEQRDVFEAQGQIGSITLHRPLALSRLLTQYRDAANLTAISRALSDQAQDLENAIHEVIVSRHLLYATGAQLDLLGAIVGEKRLGKGDSLYRKFLQARVLINRSYGRASDIAAVLQAVDPAAFEIDEPGVAMVRVRFTSPLANSAVQSAVPELVRQTRAAGVGASITFPTSASGFALRNVGASSTAALGLSSTTGGTTGGALASYARA